MNNDERVGQLRSDLKLAWNKVKRLRPLIARVRALSNKLELDWARAEAEYEALDKQLAMLDGRLKNIEPAVSGKSRRAPKLDPIDALIALAQEKGISVEELLLTEVKNRSSEPYKCMKVN